MTGMAGPGYGWRSSFGYYFSARRFVPIDKIIGRLYPVFGALLLFMSIGLTIGLDDVSDRPHASMRAVSSSRERPSQGSADLAVDVHHHRLRRDFGIPCHAIPPDGAVHARMKSPRPLRFLRRDDRRRYRRADLGHPWVCRSTKAPMPSRRRFPPGRLPAFVVNDDRQCGLLGGGIGSRSSRSSASSSCRSPRAIPRSAPPA